MAPCLFHLLRRPTLCLWSVFLSKQNRFLTEKEEGPQIHRQQSQRELRGASAPKTMVRKVFNIQPMWGQRLLVCRCRNGRGMLGFLGGSPVWRNRFLPRPLAPWVHPGSVTTHGWVVGRAAEAQSGFGRRPAATQRTGPCSGLSRSPSAPVTLFYGPAEAVARKSALGCRKIPTSPPSLSQLGPPERAYQTTIPTQSSSQRWGQGRDTVWRGWPALLFVGGSAPEMRDGRAPESESEQHGGWLAKKRRGDAIKHKLGEVSLGSRKKAKLFTHTGKFACQPRMLGRKGGAQKEIPVLSLLGNLRASGKWTLKWKIIYMCPTQHKSERPEGRGNPSVLGWMGG